MPGKSRPASHTALAALPVLVLDLETTGLDVARDRIVQIGAVAMTGATLSDEPRIDQRINPQVPVPARASQIHGLTDAELAGAPRFGEFVETLRKAIAGRVVVGHNIGFDLAVLRHEAARSGVAWLEPPALDTAMLAGALDRSLPDLGLETVATLLGVEVKNRHDALGDSLMTAHVFARLLARLREADVRTLGEAQSFAQRRADLTPRDAQADWRAAPGEKGVARLMQPPVRIDSYIYERRVDAVMSAPPMFISPDKTLGEAAELMSAKHVGALLVGAVSLPPQGILTERDLLKVLAKRGVAPESESVAGAMSTPVETAAADEMLYRALGRMTRLGIRHLCVADATGNAIGMISQRDLLRHRAGAAESLGDALAEAADAPELAQAYGHVPDVAAALVAEGSGGVEVAHVISHEIRALASRAAELSAAQLSAVGRNAPAPWCLVVLGSAGRGESLLAADQDHALVHAGSAADDGWFEEFGVNVAALLDEAGLPLCKGGVMASKPAWRGSSEDWRARIDHWLQRAGPSDLLNVDIFFDLTPVAGAAGLARALHADAVEAASRTPPFLALLAQSVASLPPITGLFGRLLAKEGRVDLKRNALLPITGIGRTLALRAGSPAHATAERLRDAADAGHLTEADADVLIEIQADVLGWILRQQLLDLENGVRPSGRVDVKSLGHRQGARLRDYLRRIDEILQYLQTAVAR
ncbi:MAG: DUF294 nucleotidyltransferase-like domain-containing protein [Burkholderiales bacterium]